jgi:uncharacterized protein (DUF1330 family)
MDYRIAAVKIGKREAAATKVQAILTEFGCNIKVRLGLHDVPSGACSPSGLIIMELVADDSEIKKFIADLNAVTDVTAKVIEI